MKSKSGQKLRARKSSCKNNTHGDQSIYNLVLQLVIALTCSLISSYYSISFDWLSYPALKQFLLNPSAISSSMSPKCLFIAMNIIVIILIADWRFTNSSSPPPTNIYDEYVKRSRIISLPRRRTTNYDLHGKIVKKVKEEKTEELVRVEEIISKREKEEEEEEVNHEVVDEVVGIEKNSDDDNKVVVVEEGDGDGDIELRTEELNRRVENFIARVNKRMWLEAHSSVSTVHGEEEEMADFVAKSFDKSIAVCG